MEGLKPPAMLTMEPDSDTYVDIMTITTQDGDNETVNQVKRNHSRNFLHFLISRQTVEPPVTSSPHISYTQT